MSILSKSVVFGSVAAAATLLPLSIFAAESSASSDYQSAVMAFQKICLVSGIDPKDRLVAIEADGRWKEETIVTVDIPKMGISKTISQNYSFAAPTSVRQWNGAIDDKKFRLVTATFGGKSRYPNLCAIVFEGADNAMPYGSSLRGAFKAFGIGGKSVDLVHYYEFAGKLGPDKNPVRGEIFSRSLSGQDQKTTHIYVAY